MPFTRRSRSRVEAGEGGKEATTRSAEAGDEARPPSRRREAPSCPKARSWPNWPSGTARSSRPPATEADSRPIAERWTRPRYAVRKIEQKDRPRRPPPPFTTSTLQQQASIRLHFAAERTMQTAQQLYEGVDLGSEG